MMAVWASLKKTVLISVNGCKQGDGVMGPYGFRALTGVAVLGFTLPAALGASPTLAQETTLALCETPGQAVRVYNIGEQTYMRAFDRQHGIVWMDRTPTRAEYNTEVPREAYEGPRYISLMGEQRVIVAVNAAANGCSIQLGSNVPEPGTLLASATSATETTLRQAHKLYPASVAALEADCAAPAALSVRPFQNQGEPQRASFVCWALPDSSGSRSGQWLGNLPLTENDPTFIKPFTCPPGDQACAAQLRLMKDRFSPQLEQAELTCSIKTGRLFFAPAEQRVDLRCGYFATTLWDNNGDGNADYEESVSVDVSVGTLPLLR
jgi:hypothetical protein